MSKRAFRSLTVLCLAIGLLFALALTANASDLTPDYYISGSPGAYAVERSEGGSEIGNYPTFVTALSDCSSDWGEKPGTPVIQLGSATTPLSVNRGDGRLISATYTGAVNIEYSSSTYGLQVYGTTVELRDFTLTNSLEGIGGEYDAVFVDTGGKLTIASGTNIIVEDGGVNNANPNALKNYGGTVTINGGVLLSIENKGRVITNYGTCTIGGNAEDDILISSSPSGGTGILNFTGGILTIGTGTTVSSNNGLLNYNTATISGGTLESSNTTVKNYAPGTLYISGGTVRNTDTNGLYNALVNNSTAVVSGGVITSDGSGCAIWTMYRLTLEGDCQVSAPNGTAVGSNTNTKAGSEINIRGNASITGKTTGVEASAATGTGGKGTSTLTITGGSISGNSYAVKTSAYTEISGGALSASGPSSTNSFALECSGGATVNISGGELIANSEQYAAYGIYNKDAAVNFSGGNVTATTKSSYGAYGIYNKATTNLSGGSITVKTDIGAPDAPTYGLHNNNATANITGGAISSEGTSNTSSAVYDMQSTSGKGIFISGTPVLKSASPYTVRLQKRTTDSGTLTYFGTSFYANANATVTVQGTYDEAAAAYVIDGDNNLGAQVCALPDAGYGSPRWTSDAARTQTLSTANPAALSALTADGNTYVYLEVKQVFNVTVTADANGTASANPSSAAAGDTVTLTATPNDGYRFKEWQVVSDGVTITDNQFIMPPANVSVKAIFEPDAFTVTVNVLGNKTYIVAPGTVQLKQGGSTYTAASAKTGVYTAAVPNGTYAVWINNEDTGKTITISDATAAVTVDYYSVIFSITNHGAAVGGSITATANGATIAKNDFVLPGKTITFTVNPGGAQTYTYQWTGNGMSGQTTQSITFTLTDYVNAVCNVTGSATYAVTLNTNGGAISGGNVTSYDYGTGAILPTDVTKTGFIFGGWYDNSGLIGSPVTAIGSTERNAKTFWAKWTAKTAIEYTPAVQSHTYGDAGATYTVNYLSLTDFTVEYYVGSTWTTVAPTNAGSYAVRITRAEDDTYASYNSGTLDVHFVINPATLTVTIKPGLTITKAYDEDATVDGVQSDWLIVSGLKNGETATASGTWSYDSADAGTGKLVNITDISISHGTAESANYSYTPVALSTTGTITNAAQPITTVEIDYMAETVSTAAIMQYSIDDATWSDCTANMVIDPGWFGATVYFRYAKKTNYDTGATQTLSIPARPAVPSATGINETSCEQSNGSISGLSDAMEYKIDTGSWTAVSATELTGLAAGTYAIRVKATESSFKSLEQEIILQNGPMLTVTFDRQGGSTVSNFTDLNYNASISAPSPDPTRIGYTFAGWYKEATCTNAWDFETDKVTANITLYAKWTADQYTITFNPGDGTVSPDSKMVTYDAAYGELPTPERTGYTFGGWWTDSDGTGDQVLASTSVTIAAAQTLYVKWTINQYIVTFSVNGGTAISPITQDYNTQIASVPSTAKPGYTFAGWFTDEGLTAAVSFPYTVADNTTLYAKWTTNHTYDNYTPPARTITVTETSSELFTGCAGEIQAEANMNNAFANSVEVKVTDTQEDRANFGFAAGDEVYPFDISLYIKGTNEKTEPAAGYTVTISLPVPQKMLDKRELLSVVHKSADGVVTTLSSRLTQVNGVWYLVFDATEFSPYALVVRSVVAYDESAGLPYYLNADESKIFIGFAANGKYIAPTGATIFLTHNAKSFTDVPGHWAAESIGFVSEREIFLGTGSDTFSPNASMTRAMFSTVIGRLYERSYGEIKTSDTHAFTDCNYGDYYGKYVDWAAENKIISGYGNGRFTPDDLITREQMAAILYRFVKFLGFLPNETDTVLSYPDSDSIAGYASDAALYCQTTGVISGRSGGIFAPQETATRSEVATIIERFVESVVE